MLVLAWDRDSGREYPDGEPVAERLPLDDLLARSDVVSVHLKLSPESTGLLDAQRLARLRPGRSWSTPPAGPSWTSGRWSRPSGAAAWPVPAWTCSPPSPCPPTTHCVPPPTWSSPPTSAGRSTRCSPSGPRSPPSSWPHGSMAASRPPRFSTPLPPTCPATASAVLPDDLTFRMIWGIRPG